MSDAPESPGSKPDYRSTVFLPKTDFPMKAGLPQKEPAILARWEEGDLYAQTRAARAGRDKFIFHDGPPYANGNIHVGHALNHAIKDMVVRTQTLLGKDAPYVPGWDCHGLPIEWKVEEQYRKKKLNKDEVPIKEFRAECRAYAQHWVDVQREQLKRLGVGARWDKPYLTMNAKAEGTIVAELMKFAESGQLYRGAKPVMWSPVEKTALAEAEIEYEDIVSTQIDLAFEIVESPIPELVGAHAVVWTTTPWTIPVNQGIAYNLDTEYVAIRMAHSFHEGPALSPWSGKTILVAKELADATFSRGKQTTKGQEIIWQGKGSALVGAMAKHPMAGRLSSSSPLVGEDQGGGRDASASQESLSAADAAGPLPNPSPRGGGDKSGFFAKPRPFLAGDFVTTDQGTGLVHMSPDHGEDDFELCRDHGIGPVFAVEGDGKYRADWEWLGGQGSVINAKFNSPEGPILTDLAATGQLLSASDFKHSYPHSWRSKAKVIYRCTPQWFIAMDRPIAGLDSLPRAVARWENEGGATDSPSPPGGEGWDEGDRGPSETTTAEHPHPVLSLQGEGSTLRSTALNAIADTRFVPEKGRNRLGSMVEGRPDWVISRQRAWGVPIALFVERKSGELLVDRDVNARIVAAITAEGVDAWDEARAGDYLGQGRDPADYEMVPDILDVWFDSGSTHAFVLESGEWPELSWPADIYVEGSDQHRGWFQSSLLESCGTRGRAPFNTLLTHGFTMDSKGMKMSKSLGNTVDPLKVMETYGADIIRLWALSVDFTEDHRIGDEILKGVSDQYRKLRNTFRYLLGALDGFGEDERLDDVAAFPELERYMLSLLAKLDQTLRNAVDDFDFNTYVRALTDFCNEDLSAFYFDIRKDCLYCDAAGDPKRRAYRTVLDTLFHALVRWLSPVLVFTTEEVWGTRFPNGGSVHLLEWPVVPQIDANEVFMLRWVQLRNLRDSINESIEPLRREKIIGSSLEAAVIAYDVEPEYERELFQTMNLPELLIVSEVKLGPARLSGNHVRTGDGATLELVIQKAENHKCGRCWRYLPEVKSDGGLCDRCEQVVNG
ncbi:MAG: isoleucine--tRNA ligase [Pseudomonadota bacterium]